MGAIFWESRELVWNSAHIPLENPVEIHSNSDFRPDPPEIWWILFLFKHAMQRAHSHNSVRQPCKLCTHPLLATVLGIYAFSLNTEVCLLCSTGQVLIARMVWDRNALVCLLPTGILMMKNCKLQRCPMPVACMLTS